MPSSLTQLVHLQDLNLSGNALTSIPDGINALTDLRKLSLHGNRLQQVPQEGWQHLQQLDEVCLQGNELTAVPASLAKLGVSGRGWVGSLLTVAHGNDYAACRCQW